jgi:hypothetical protein
LTMTKVRPQIEAIPISASSESRRSVVSLTRAARRAARSPPGFGRLRCGR